MAAPIAGQILGEVLPYLEVYKAEEEESKTVKVPNCIGLTVEEAKKVLEGFEIEIQSETYSKEDVITKQIPDGGIETKENGKVLLYLN